MSAGRVEATGAGREPDGAGLDLYDSQRSIAGGPSLAPFVTATILNAADVQVAMTLGRIGGSDDRDVLLAAALAVRAVRLGHVFVDLATAATSVAPDDEEIDVDVASLPWPAVGRWATVVGASRLSAIGPESPDGPDSSVAVGDEGAGGGDGNPARPLRLIGSRLYLDRYWRHERGIADDLLWRSDRPAPAVDEVALRAGLDRLFGTRHSPAAFGDGATDRVAGDDLQRIAAASVVLRRFSVIAGGPGTCLLYTSPSPRD